MTVKKQKQLNQLSEYFGLSSDVIIKQIDDMKEFYAQYKDDFLPEDEQTYNVQMQMLENELKNEDVNPLAEQILDELIDKLGDKRVTSILNMISSKEFEQLFKIVDDVLVGHAKKSIDMIDDAIQFEQQKKSGKLH
jgi:restriction endonuclease Mrr